MRDKCVASSKAAFAIKRGERVRGVMSADEDDAGIEERPTSAPKRLRIIAMALGFFGILNFTFVVTEGIQFLVWAATSSGGLATWVTYPLFVVFMVIPLGLLLSTIGIWYLWRWGWYVPVATLTFFVAVKAGMLASIFASFGSDYFATPRAWFDVSTMLGALVILKILRSEETRDLFRVPAWRYA